MEIQLINKNDLEQIITEMISKNAFDRDRWLSDQECADILGIKVSSFRSNYKHRIPSHRIGKKNIRYIDLQNFLLSQVLKPV